MVGFSPGGCRLPSPRERGGGGDEGTGTAAAAGGDWSSESAPARYEDLEKIAIFEFIVGY